VLGLIFKKIWLFSLNIPTIYFFLILMTDTYQALEIKISESSKDDLTKIKGIGTTTAEKLYNAKIVSVQQIAEMTPDRLSETPGIGLATATKFIVAAKDLLETFQKEVVVSEPTRIQKEVEVQTTPKPIEYEVEEVIVDVNIGEEFDQTQTDLDNQSFTINDQYSKLTATYPPMSEQDFVEEDKEDEKEITVIEIIDNNAFDTESKKELVNEYEEDSSQKIHPSIELQKQLDQPEQKDSDEGKPFRSIPAEINIAGTKYSVDSTFESIIHQQLSDIFKDVGCHEIPGSLQSLKRFTTELDYLGCKVVKISDDLKIMFMFPVKLFDTKGTVLVDEAKVDLKSYSSEIDLGAYYEIDQVTKNLLQVRDLMYEDVASDTNILTFFQKYLQINLSLEKGFGPKSLVFLSGSVQYKVYIEPILLCYNPPRSMEKSLVFPYQRSTNLHAVTRSDLAPLVKFLEKKYRMIEVERKKKPSSLKDYKQAEVTFR